MSAVQKAWGGKGNQSSGVYNLVESFQTKLTTLGNLSFIHSVFSSLINSFSIQLLDSDNFLSAKGIYMFSVRSIFMELTHRWVGTQYKQNTEDKFVTY